MPSIRRPATLAQLLSPAIAGAVVLVAAASLSGCTAISDALHHQHEEHFDTYAAAAKGWVGVKIPDWIPTDATDLRNLATTNELDAVIRVTSASTLPEGCVTEMRVGLPFASGNGIPALTTPPENVQRCGDYEVIAAKGGWMGWYEGLRAGDRPSPGVTPTS